jgi:hypothetical protein
LPIPGYRINYPFNRPYSKYTISPAGGTFFLWTGTQRKRVFKFNAGQCGTDIIVQAVYTLKDIVTGNLFFINDNEPCTAVLSNHPHIF